MEQNKEFRMNPHAYAQLLYDKGSKNIQWGEKTISLTSGARKTGQLHAKESNCTSFSDPIQKTNSK